MELKELESEIGDGRPFRMRQKTYNAKLERLQELVQPLVASLAVCRTGASALT